MSIEVVGEGEATAEPKHKPLTDEQVSKLAKDYYSGHIFGSWQIPNHSQNLIGMIFMVLFFLDDITKKQMINDGTVHVYEYISEAGPQSINGYPTFFSCHMITVDDLKRVIAKAQQIKEVMDTL